VGGVLDLFPVLHFGLKSPPLKSSFPFRHPTRTISDLQSPKSPGVTELLRIVIIPFIPSRPEINSVANFLDVESKEDFLTWLSPPYFLPFCTPLMFD